jgi:hypothetical protein
MIFNRFNYGDLLNCFSTPDPNPKNQITDEKKIIPLKVEFNITYVYFKGLFMEVLLHKAATAG